MSLGEDGLPQVTEVAFAALEDEHPERSLITGVNWSAAWINPFRTLGEYGRSLDTMMSDRRFSADAADRAARPRRASARPVRRPRQVDGAGAMRSDDILQALDSVGKKWTKQVKAEEKPLVRAQSPGRDVVPRAHAP